ncbi:MAG: serine/threonine protein kinase, partial [Microcystis aeruginosa W13-13]|nr:serine/threonine protein kinase [Microcystis aeruginosa W13-13]
SDLYSLGATLIYLATGIHPADLPQKDGKIQLNNLANLSPAFVHWLGQLIEPSLEKRFVSAQAANQALNTLQEMQLTASNLEKPAGSRVQLQKSEEKIKIFLPPEGFTPKLIYLGAFAIAWNAFLLVWTGGAVSIPLWMSWFFLLFSLPFWFVGLGMLYQIIYCLKGEEIITIDRQEIVAIQRIWCLTLSGKKKMAREHINKLVKADSYHTKDSDGDRVYVPMALTIWVGTKEYTISSKTKEYLSNPEIEWLAAELSQWLGIPITNN